MKITIERQILCDAVGHVARAVSSKSTIPALEGILLSAEKSELTLIAYNLEIGMTKILDARVDEPGDIILNARLFGDIVRRLPGETVILTVDERLMCHIESGSATFDILGISAAEYPEMPSMTECSPVTLSGSLLRDMVRQTIFAVADPQSSPKPVHTGILFELEENSIRLIAVDGYRLAIRHETISGEAEMKFIVAGKAIGEAVRLISDEEENVLIKIGRRHVSFEIGGYTLISRLLEGEYLDYKNTLPKAHTTSVKMNAREVAETVERISLIISDRLKSPVRCKIERDELVLSCVTSLGRAVDVCTAETEGDVLEIGFNSRYFLDALSASETDEVILECNGPLAPMLIRPPEGDSFLFMVMPVRLKNE